MEEGFELPVSYNDKELLFPAKLVQYGYSYRIEVDVEGIIISFEKDEERNWRALVDSDSKNNFIIQEILQALATSLDKLLS